MVNCAVIGLGQLGCRIAVEIASYGHMVKVYDRDGWQCQTIFHRAEQHWLQLERTGLIESAIKFHEYILVCSDLKTAVENADFVFEAASENIHIKKSLLKEITLFCDSQTVIGTNTLTLPLKLITEDALFSERILGIRFLYPVFAIPFIEYTATHESSHAAISKAKAFFESLNKALVRKDDGDPPKKLDSSEVEYYQSAFRAKRMGDSHRRTVESYHVAHGAAESVQKNEITHHGCTADIKRPVSESQPVSNATGPVVSASPENADECVVCNENSINAILFPCRHMWLCFPCAQRLKTLGKPCPACRANINDIISVFKP